MSSEDGTLKETLENITSALRDLTTHVAAIESRSETRASVTMNRQESETISESRAQLESQVSASPSNIGAADVHRDYERVKESVCSISIPNQYKVQDSATGIKQDCKPVPKVVTKCARFAETGMKIMLQMPADDGDHQQK